MLASYHMRPAVDLCVGALVGWFKAVFRGLPDEQASYRYVSILYYLADWGTPTVTQT